MKKRFIKNSIYIVSTSFLLSNCARPTINESPDAGYFNSLYGIVKKNESQMEPIGQLLSVNLYGDSKSDNYFEKKEDVYLQANINKGFNLVCTSGTSSDCSTVPGNIGGYYVFQVTDKDKTALLSEDPAKCRIVEIDSFGKIVRLVRPSSLNSNLTDSYNGSPCHDNSGNRHKSSHEDASSTSGSVIQLTPFLENGREGASENEFKVSLISLDLYRATVEKGGNGGDLEAMPKKKNGYFELDPGFSKNLNFIIEHEFKVKTANGSSQSLSLSTNDDTSEDRPIPQRNAPSLEENNSLNESNSNDSEASSESTATVSATSTSTDTSTSTECTNAAVFDGKGYWHNSNGLAEISNNTGSILDSNADVVYINSLASYSTASVYFANGDEPFDGRFTDNTCVSKEGNDAIAASCTIGSEISKFLKDSHSGLSTLNKAKGKLAQHLLAFIFNIHHRLPSPSDLITLDDNSQVSGTSLVNSSITLLSGSDTSAINTRASLLDSLNNDASVQYTHTGTCN